MDMETTTASRLTAFPVADVKPGDTLLASGTKRVVAAVTGWTVTFVDGLTTTFVPETTALGFR